MLAPHHIAEVGTALHGRKWRNALSRDLGVSESTVRRWASGKIAVPKDLGERLVKAIDLRLNALLAVKNGIRSDGRCPDG